MMCAIRLRELPATSNADAWRAVRTTSGRAPGHPHAVAMQALSAAMTVVVDREP